MSEDVTKRALDIASEKMTKEANDKEWDKVAALQTEVAEAFDLGVKILSDEKEEDKPRPTEVVAEEGEKPVDEEDVVEARRNALKSGLISPPDLVVQDSPPKEKEKNNRDRTRKIGARTPPSRKGMRIAGASTKGSSVGYASSNREPNKRSGEFKIRPNDPINNIGHSTIHKGDGK